MSRTLARLRAATGDPLLVRAGRGLVPTPHATELRDRVHQLTRDARTALSPHAGHLDVASVERTFTIRAGEGFVEQFSAPLVAAITAAAPHVRLRFAPKTDKDALPLRDGQIDLEIGVLGASAPEVRTGGRSSLWRPGFRMRCASRATPTWLRLCHVRVLPARSALTRLVQVLSASTFPFARRRSRFRRCGIPGWTRTRRIDGCATRSWLCARPRRRPARARPTMSEVWSPLPKRRSGADDARR
jgi:DNA-binding transcriptional LysR family regulator